MTERQQAAQRIIANPTAYQVCEGCDSVVSAITVTCPNCHGYNLNPDTDRVKETALRLGDREKQSVTPEDLQ